MTPELLNALEQPVELREDAIRAALKSVSGEDFCDLYDFCQWAQYYWNVSSALDVLIISRESRFKCYCRDYNECMHAQIDATIYDIKNKLITKFAGIS